MSPPARSPCTICRLSNKKSRTNDKIRKKLSQEEAPALLKDLNRNGLRSNKEVSTDRSPEDQNYKKDSWK